MDAPSTPTSSISTYNPGDIAWVLISTALVWLMIPGVGYFYSGMARRKNALSLIMCCVLSLVIVSVQWFIWGYSLTFSKTATSGLIGNLDYAFLRGVLGDPSIGNTTVPDLVFCVYQCMFAALTPALAIGSAAERGRLLPMIIFIFIWSTLVYNVVASWTWNLNGWSAKLGAIDYAGGTPVHITSGFASLAYAIILGRREGHDIVLLSSSSSHKRNSNNNDPQIKAMEEEFKPHNMSNVVLGTALLWFGWFGFNGGSGLSGNLRAAMACVVTNLAASVGAITWMLIDYRVERKFSALGFCSGAVAGLVAITPASGFVGPAPAVAIGFLGACACNLAVHLKRWLRYDDVADVFAVHGIGGYVGSLLTGLFAESYVAALDGTSVIKGGWMNHHWAQLGYQLAEATAGAAWSFVITYLILFIMNKIPGLSLRVDRESELQGLDVAEIGEMAYYHVDKIIGVNRNTGEEKIMKEEIERYPFEAQAQDSMDVEKPVVPGSLSNA
ncbi:ammonium transporter AmtB-like domain-containing protein [Mycotypha africana]|uniref:ammonium transporter AmtB-like domain-containing protein n=1 Tax=Mycotypha africana TaxID=64632 RepID=UPI002300EDB2|nr:ammonium transporter AmtB-like domain-containing protein [Mycotypha africana]KAI8984326.1 ammonium transporter AmtB-like domain-containing protein [Mycotypha africana]